MMARAAAPSAMAAASSRPTAPARLPRSCVSLTAARGVCSQPQHRLARPAAAAAAPPRNRACTCSPTTHPGSFRCALHRKRASPAAPPGTAPVSSRLSAARLPSMASPLARIAAVEKGGDHIRRALASLVRPSSQQHQRRRADFRPRPSCLSAMSTAADKPSP
ncbi:uncharacterized protein LOC133899208 [Phragmites australis]|uniref:uncharacterized protein LOC133899208 n=1 Tax=Phragmites australis TaxID=29695 RepID=UPI002D797FA4|nr:uncharacterized protein LOC133899208 [Phragmites australis]